MAIKKYGPTTPGRRGMTVTDYSVLSKVAPERSLLEPMKKHSGRNNTGRITVRHQGGGNRTKYRVIDFKRQKTDRLQFLWIPVQNFRLTLACSDSLRYDFP